MEISNEARIAAEAALLKAIADDNIDAVAHALGSSGDARALLSLEVKETLNDASDDSAFYHSVASYGLKFGLGDKAVQLARKNGKSRASEALGALCHACDLPYLSRDEERVAAERLLLRAIAADDSDAVLRSLEGDVSAEVLLSLRVKETFGILSDCDAFYNSVASFGLKFSIGDDAQGLAERNGFSSAARALRARSRKADTDAIDFVPAIVHVCVRQISGELLAELDVSNSSRVSELLSTLDHLAPLPPGLVHRALLLGETQLDPDSPLATYINGSTSVDLTALTVTGGVFQARLELELADGIRGGRRQRGGHTDIILMLKRNGVATFSYTNWPIDTGHCAGSSGGRKLAASGSWSVVGLGVRVKLRDGRESSMSRGYWDRAQPVDLMEQELLFSRSDDGLVALESPKCESVSMGRQVSLTPGTRFSCGGDEGELTQRA